MATERTHVDLPVAGMDCADCVAHVEGAIRQLPGVEEVRVLLSAERATVAFDPQRVTLEQIKAAVDGAGYSVPAVALGAPLVAPKRDIGQVIGWGALSLVAVIVLGAAVGERFGLFDSALARLPWWVPATAILLGGWPVFRGVVRAAGQRQVTSHTLMTVGTLASIAIGQWSTAALIVFFMRFGAWLEELTAERNRQALKGLIALQPATACVLRGGQEVEVPLAAVIVGDDVLVRPGGRIPVGGQVTDGLAAVDQASVTGESIPVDKIPGDHVFAATVVQGGFLTVQATGVGRDTAFGRIVRMVEEAETHKAPVQRFADRFSTFDLPAVLVMGLITYLLTRQVVNAVAVLVVSCACAIVIATPVVVLASVATAARRGVLIKGGAALEQLARVDTIVMDKTGTLTRGQPLVSDVLALAAITWTELLRAVASVESRSEHPLARALVRAAAAQDIVPAEPGAFLSLPGRGLVGTVAGQEWTVGNRRLLTERGIVLQGEHEARAQALEGEGKTVFFVAAGSTMAGLVAVADIVRPEVCSALAELRSLGIRRLLLLTGDNERVATAVAGALGLEYRAGLLPEGKIAQVKALQAAGSVVMMVGDGVNDAPALAQADVGVAMGAGPDVALEAADVALVRDDWRMVPEAIRIGRRGARTVRQNLAFTALYNVVGITLAAIGVLPPVWAAAAQSLPDVAIMLNSARLLRLPAARNHEG